MPVLSDRVGTFTDSVIRRMTRINNQYDSINLSQGFPDFDPPKQLLDALAETAYKGPHQYAVTFGAQNFREALAKKTSPALHHEVDPNTEICVTCGGTEAMMAAMMMVKMIFSGNVLGILVCTPFLFCCPNFRRKKSSPAGTFVSRGCCDYH